MKPYLTLRAPEELTIFYNGEGDGHISNLTGQVSCINVQSLVTRSIDTHIHLHRIGRFKNTNRIGTDQHCKRRLSFFRPSSQICWKDFESAETLLSCTVHLALDAKSKKSSCEFQLRVPAHLLPTTAFPSIEISYAIIVSGTLPCGQLLQTGQLLRISRRSIEPIPLQATPTAYSQSLLSLHVSFEEPKPRVRILAPTLHLKSLSSISLNSSHAPLARDEQIIPIVPQIIQWEIEEKVVIFERQDGNVEDLSTLPISETARIVKQGIHRSVAGPLPPKSGDKLLGFDAEIPFQIDMPENVDLPSPLVATECFLDTWSPEHSCFERARFALYMEHNLRIRLQMCEDLTTENSGGCKPVWHTYTTVLPLKGLSKHGDDVSAVCQEKYCITREAL